MIDEIKADQEDTGLMIQQIPQQTPFNRYTIWHCHVLSISTLRREASRDRENRHTNLFLVIAGFSFCPFKYKSKLACLGILNIVVLK
jgi:hypothetical protein